MIDQGVDQLAVGEIGDGWIVVVQALDDDALDLGRGDAVTELASPARPWLSAEVT